MLFIVQLPKDVDTLTQYKKDMGKIKCITFDKAAQDALSEHIKEKMREDRDKFRQGLIKCPYCDRWYSKNDIEAVRLHHDCKIAYQYGY